MAHESELSRITGYYDSISASYDTETAGVGWQRVNECLTEALRSGGRPSPVSAYLDLGAGTGQTIETVLASGMTNASTAITAVDISGKMLETLTGKNLHPNIDTVQTDFTRYLEISKERFDVITAVGFLEFTPAQKISFILGALATHLHRDGIMVITYRPLEAESPLTIGNERVQHFWPSDLVEATLARNGIAACHAASFTAYHVTADPEKAGTIPYACRQKGDLVGTIPHGILKLMKIYSWNVNGIRSVDKKGALAEFIQKEQPDIVCFQEVKAHEADIDLEFPEYEKFWNSGSRKGYAGTAIWSKVQPVKALYDLPEELITEYKLDSDHYGNPSGEGRVTALEFDGFYVVTVYTPNSKNDLTRLELRHKQWDPAFLKYVSDLAKSKPVFFCGDLNVAHKEIDLANPKPNVGKHGFTNEEREGFDRMLEAGFTDTFRAFNQEPAQYTWWTHWANARARNVGWRIDYFLASQKGMPLVKTAAIHPGVMGSDHCPVSITIETPKE